MIALFRLELLRVARDRRFWFWSLVGVPVLLPAAVVIVAFALASLGTVEPQAVRPVVATTADDPALLSHLEDSEILFDRLPTREAVVASITDGRHSVGLVDLSLAPGEPMSATFVSIGSGRELPIYRSLVNAIDQFAADRRTSLVESLDFHGPSFDLLLKPIDVYEELAPSRIPPGLVQVVTVIWSTLLVFPYLLLTWNGGSRAVTDRQSGYLASLNASAIPPWRWLIARWAVLSAVAGALLLFSAVLFSLYMRAYATVADVLVAEGILEGLSESALVGARAYLVEAVALWRETSIVAYLLWLLLAAFQLSAVCALVLWGSVKASSLPQYRLFELLPFAVVFFLPLVGLGLLGVDRGLALWLPGLNTVLSIEHVVSGALPGGPFFLSGLAVLLSNLLLAACFLGLGALSLRNERLWSV